ncbi:MAG: tripartite tricarboxylate transporter substrate-binding protein [Planctomycetota bacterium]
MRIRLICLLLLAFMVGCDRDNSFPSRPITLVCPWAAGGGTDRVSRQMAMLLEQRLGQPVSVINATGGKGVTGHSRGLTARPDGHTLTMMTFELNTMHWAGLTDLTYQDCIPLVSVNEDYAALMVRSDAMWATIAELEADIQSEPRSLTASGTALGGAWHLALAGWLTSADLEADAVTWVPSAGANPSLQQLISGGVDMVCCSLPEARTMLESDQIRALGVMSPKRAVGFEQVPTFVEQGRDWTLGGWRGLALPRDTPPEVVALLSEHLIAIVSEDAVDGSFAAFMESQKFDHTWRDPEAFKTFLAENDRKLGELLQSDSMKSINTDRFSPMAYPWLLIGMMGITLAGLWIKRNTETQHDDDESAANPSVPVRGFANAGAVIAAIVAYVCLAEQFGFLVVVSGLLLALLVRFGTHWMTSVIITAVTVPAVYILFATLLRVPLP